MYIICIQFVLVCVHVTNAHRKYDEINQFLVDHVNVLDAEANVKAARDWLNSGAAKHDPKLEDALKMFISMGDIMSGNEKCGKKAYEILVQNDRETDKHSHARLDTLNRVERVINHYNSLNSRECSYEYPLMYEKIYQTLDEAMIKRVEEYANEVAIHMLIGITVGTNFLNRDIYRQRITDSSQMGNILTSAIIQGLEREGNPDKASTLKSQINKFILEPCAYYDQHLGEEIFLPAGYSFMWNFGVQNKEQHFYTGFARYRICQFTVDNQDLLEGSVNEAVQSMSQLCKSKEGKNSTRCLRNMFRRFRPAL